MFVQFKKINNESGIVLFIVLMTAIIIMILSVGILTQSMNEINYAQQRIDQISTEELAKGVFWQMYSAPPSASTAPNNFPTGMTNNRTYGSQVTYTAATGVYNVTVNYDTFN